MNAERHRRIEEAVHKLDDFRDDYENVVVYEAILADIEDIQVDEEVAYDRLSGEEKDSPEGRKSEKADRMMDQILESLEEVIEHMNSYVSILEEDGEQAAEFKKQEISEGLEEVRDILQNILKL